MPGRRTTKLPKLYQEAIAAFERAEATLGKEPIARLEAWREARTVIEHAQSKLSSSLSGMLIPYVNRARSAERILVASTG